MSLGIHIVPQGKKWAVRMHDAYRAWRLFDTSEAAFAAAMLVHRKRKDGILYIHDKTGRIAKRLCRPAVLRGRE